MSFINASGKISDIQDTPEKFRFIEIFLKEVKDLINGRLSLNKNTFLSPVQCYFNAVNEDTSFSHKLGRVPRGYLVISKDSSMVVYDSLRGSSSSLIYLRSSAVGTAQIVFL